MKHLLPIIFLCSCSPQWHIKRAIKKDPSILQPKEITVIDTFITDPILKTDTFTLSEFDTLRIDTGRIHYEIIRQRDSFFVRFEVPGDTIIKDHYIYVDRIKYVDCPDKKKPILRQIIDFDWTWLLVLLLAIGLYKVIKWIRK